MNPQVRTTHSETQTILEYSRLADLDSITSSIVYAYLRTSSQLHSSDARLHIPLVNIPRTDIDLRPELLALLPYANIDRNHLITLDDLPEFSSLKEDLPARNTRWVLVDHNALQGKLGALYSDRVVGTIDHHVDEGTVPKDTGSEPRVITTSGSCSSLVVNYCQDTWNQMSSAAMSSGAAHGQDDSLSDDSAVASLWDAQVAHLALASILIDTHNLLDEGKVTEHDKRAVALLEAKINICPKTSKQFNRDAFFGTIDDAKRDLDSMPLDGILRKDYKQWTEQGMDVGISSVVKPISYLKEKSDAEAKTSRSEDLIGIARAFAKQRSLSVYAIMTTFESEDGRFSRELLVLAPDQKGTEACKRFLEQAGSELKLEDVEGNDDEGHWVRLWNQHNVACSRKQVAPMIRKAMASEKV